MCRSISTRQTRLLCKIRFTSDCPSLEAIRHHPRLEAFKARNIEVLLMTDPVDEFSSAIA